ncbi:TraB/GumN family protein [Fretibacter rubidus]|uniref:TraB/GumN family protein n=1 Tax=Fretibacter rubidus TaxID=570162 RepID=UPI00352A1D5F
MTYLRSLLTTTLAISTVALGLSACTNAQTDADTQSAVASAEDISAALKSATDRAKESTGPGSPALWSISDDDTTVYLFGTIHLLRPETQWRTEAFNQAFERADTLYLEVDTTSAEGQAAVQRIVAQEGMFAEGETLMGVLDDEEEATLMATMGPMGATADAINGFKPWLLGLQLSVGSIMQAGYDPNKGVDTLLASEAKLEGKTLKYLETIERQIGVLSSADMDEQIDGLMVTVETLNLGTEFVDVLASEWADGDVTGLTATMADPLVFGGQEGYDALMVDRNRDWIPAISSALDEPGVKFVAVGAGHMVGPDSVIAMLKTEGLSAQRLQ